MCVMSCCNEGTTSSTRVCGWDHRLGVFWVVHHHLPYSIWGFNGQTGETNADTTGTITPVSLVVLRVALISAVPPKIQFWFWFSVLAEEKYSIRVYRLAFITIMYLTPLVRKSMWGYCRKNVPSLCSHCDKGSVIILLDTGVSVSSDPLPNRSWDN